MVKISWITLWTNGMIWGKKPYVWKRVSKNNVTPKSSILIGFSIIFTTHFGVFPLFLEPPICYSLKRLKRLQEPTWNFCRVRWHLWRTHGLVGTCLGGRSHDLVPPFPHLFRYMSNEKNRMVGWVTKGDEISYPVIFFGHYKKPWNKDPGINHPGFHGK